MRAMLPSALLLSAFACATPKPASDSAGAAIDTLKPAVVAAPDSMASSTGATTASAPTSATSRQREAPAKSGSRPDSGFRRDTTHLGRDSVIKINPRDPRRMIPTKKPDTTTLER